MPALQWFGRRWRSGTDDFTVSSVFFFILLVISGILILSCPKNGFSLCDCPHASRAFTDILFSTGVVDVVGSLSFLLLAVLSCRGTPFQETKRRHVSTLLYLNLFILLAMLGLWIPLIKFGIHDGENRRCDMFTRGTVIYALVVNFLIPILFLLFVLFAYDPNGRRDYEEIGEYNDLWWRRCRKYFRVLREDDAYMDVARTFATTFRSQGLVPSDVVAGMFLLHGRQQREHRLRHGDLHYGVAHDGRCERLSWQAKPFPELTDEQVQQLRDIRIYSRFYLGAYGWMLHEYMNFCTGLPKLCCFDPTMCCRHHPGIHKGTTCFCDLTSLLKTTGIDDDDVILTSWMNTPFSPVFYVAIDRSTNAVVIAIRGTMSLADCVTDFVASPSCLQIPEDEVADPFDAEGYYVHGGMKRSAEYVLSELVDTGVKDRLIDGDLSGYNLVLLGHSLGAGVASILSIMLWSSEPSLRHRLRCIAYAPPGGLLSPALVAYSKSFVIGCFAGNDMIPRTSIHTFEDLQDSIFDALAMTNLPKTRIFFNFCSNKHYIKENPSSESRLYREKLPRLSSDSLTRSRKLYPPATLVHYCKAVVRARSNCCLSERCIHSVQEDVFVPTFGSPEDVQVVICSPSMFTDHFPDRLFDVINETERLLKEGDLHRFFTSSPGFSQSLPSDSSRNFDSAVNSSLV